MANPLDHSERPFRILTVGAAGFLVLYALIAVWILTAADSDDRISLDFSEGTHTVVVSGELPSASSRDELFAALSQQSDIRVIVSEVTIRADADPPPPIDELAGRLLDEFGNG